MSQFQKLVEANQTFEKIAAYLDSLSHKDRLQEVQSFPGKLQSQLFTLAKPNVSVEDLIPKNGNPLKEVIFYGKNSLPFFSIFQKRMCRSEDGLILVGYNHQGMKWMTGPGYFIVDEKTDRTGEVMIDYTRLPQKTPQQWPPIKTNNSGITRLVYGNMKDYLRRVSQHVFIGEATKNGKKMGQYFLLCRA